MILESGSAPAGWPGEQANTPNAGFLGTAALSVDRWRQGALGHVGFPICPCAVALALSHELSLPWCYVRWAPGMHRPIVPAT